MTLTNRELAKNLSFTLAAAFLACPQCNYLTKSKELTNPQAPCPKCGITGVTRHIFPDLSSLKLLEMVGYFYVKACDRIEDKKAELVDVLREKIDQTYEPQLVIKTAREIQNFYQKYGGKQSEYDKILKIIQERLSLQSGEEAEKVFVPLFGYSNTFEEHKVVVILTCTLLEKLFGDLLVLIYTRKGMNWSEAEKKVQRLDNFPKRCDSFKEETNLSLEKASNQDSMLHGFFQNWLDIRKARNTFVHGSPYIIKISTAEKAFNLAKNAFSFFAYLQNRFCIQVHRV